MRGIGYYSNFSKIAKEEEEEERVLVFSLSTTCAAGAGSLGH